MKNNPSSKSLTKNSIFYLLYNFLNIAFPLATGIYVARILLPLNIGQIESARNLAQYFVILSFLGIPTYGLREIAKNRDSQSSLNNTFSELVIINSVSTLTFLLAFFSLIVIVPFYRDQLLLYSICGLSIALNFFNISWLYEGLEEFKYISIRNIIFKSLTFLLLIILVRKQTDYLWYALITVIGTAGNYFFNVLRAKKYVSFSFKNLNLRRHFRPILFLFVVNIAIEIYLLVDVTMLGLICNSETVAFYSYGMKIYRILLQLINTFTVVVVPRLANYFKKGKENEFNHLITKTLLIILIFSIPAVIGIFFTSDYVLCALYGTKYIRSSTVLKILSLILLFSPVGYLLGSRVLLIHGDEKKMLIPVICGALVNVFANLVLIYALDEIGAALASLTSEIIVMVIYLFLGRGKYRLVGLSDSFWKILVASLFVFCFLFFVSFLPTKDLIISIIQIVGSIVIYFGLLLILKEKISYSFFVSLKKRFGFKNESSIQ